MTTGKRHQARKIYTLSGYNPSPKGTRDIVLLLPVNGRDVPGLLHLLATEPLLLELAVDNAFSERRLGQRLGTSS